MDQWSDEFNNDILILPEDKELAALYGGVTHAEGTRLSLLASQIPTNLAIVEIGCFRGKSSCFLGAGSRTGNGAKLYSIDPWDKRPPYGGATKPYHDIQNKVAFDENIKKFSLENIVTAIREYSVEAAKIWNLPIGLLHIDGDHGYEGVKSDYEAWFKFVVHGGVIAFHDYGLPPVRKFIDESVKPLPIWREWMLHNRLLVATRV